MQAGSGGYNVTVKGNTNLVGAIIGSTAEAANNSLTTGSLTTSSLANVSAAAANSSATSIGTGMLDGKYALVKTIVGNAMNKGSATSSDASTTTSAVSSGTVTVGGVTTNTANPASATLKDSNGNTVANTTASTNRTLARADLGALQTSAQQKQAGNVLLISTLTVVGDKVYRKETEQKKLDRLSCESANKEGCSRQENVTLDQVKAVDGKITAVNNGTLNSAEQAIIVAYMQSTGMQLQDGVLVVVNPKINDVLSEAAWVAWKKVEQVFGFGTSSAGELNLALLMIAASQGAKLDTVSHSAGNFATDEMLRRLQESAVTNAAVGTVTLFGSPVNAQTTSDKVNSVTSGQGTTQQATHIKDFVGTVFGGNTGTGGNPNTEALPSHSSYTGDLTTSTVKLLQLPNIQTPWQIRETTNAAWGADRFSQPVVITPSDKAISRNPRDQK